MARGMERVARNPQVINLRLLSVLLILAACGTGAWAQENAPEKVVDLPGGGAVVSGPGGKGAVKLAPPAAGSNSFNMSQLPDLSKRENLSSALQLVILLTVLSLAPAILIMMTSFTRIIIVMSLLRQALGTQQLPPNQ